MHGVRSLLFSLTALSMVGGCRSAAEDAGAPVAVDPSALYGRFCARCHGNDGKGAGEPGQRMKIPDLTGPTVAAMGTEKLEQVISAGRGQMPGFGNMATPPKIQAMAGYVRRLAAQTAAASKR